MFTEGSDRSQWTVFLNVMIESGKYFDADKCSFTDELSLVKLCQDPLLSGYISSWLSRLNQNRKRSHEVASDFIEQGNRHFNRLVGSNDLSVECYTKAIFSSPKDSFVLAMAHSLRASCLLSSERFYEEGYFDCRLALTRNFPKVKLPELFQNKLTLARLTDKRDEYTAETLREMKKLRVSLANGVVEAILKITAKAPDDDEEWNDESKEPIINKTLIEKRNSSVGRFLVTEEAIKAGEQIYCEKVFSFVPIYNELKEDEIQFTCQNCAKINCLPFTCTDCARVSYCSPMCLANHTPIHKYECVGYQKNLWIKLGSIFLAFRTFLIGFEEMVQILENTKASTVEEVWSILNLDCHQDFSYGHVLRMLTRNHKLDVRKVLRFALSAKMLVIYLSDYTDFFNNLPPVCKEILASVDDWKTVIAALLLKHVSQAVFNAHRGNQVILVPPSRYKKSYGYGSYDIHPDDLRFVVKSELVNTAFYPRLSIINHSCDPNVHYTVNGMNLYAHAIRDIGQNEEITACYGQHFKLWSTKERQQRMHTDFYFDCNCHRCVRKDDTTWSKYYEYYCTDKACNVPVEFDVDVNVRWWLYVDDPDYVDHINEKFVCGKCGDMLPVNPETTIKFNKTAYGFIEKKGFGYQSQDRSVITKNLLNMYFKAANCLGKYHELRMNMAILALSFSGIDSDVAFFPKLAYLTMESFVNQIERYGIHSQEFIATSTYALSILKRAAKIERTNTLAPMARDIAKIRRILDVAKIERSVQFLPHSLRKIFRNTIRDLDEHVDIGCSTIGEKFNNVRNSFSVDSGFNSERSVG